MQPMERAFSLFFLVLVRGGQNDGEGGTAADLALDFDVATLGFNEVLGNRKSQPGSA